MVSKLKKLRIPGVVKILDSVETDASLIIATEHVRPLHSVIDDLSEDTKVWGLYNVINTIHHVSGGGCVHGNINLGSIFVNDAGEWLVGGLELTTVTESEEVLFRYGSLLPGSGNYAPPEVAKQGWQISQRQPQTVDAFQVGNLIYDVFNGTPQNPSSARPSRRGKIPTSHIYNISRQMSAVEPRKRTTVDQVITSKAIDNFHSPMVEIGETLASLTIVSEDQLSLFLAKLNENQDKFPREYLHYKVLPQVAAAIDLGLQKRSAGGSVSNATVKGFQTVVALSKDLNPQDYARIVSPIIIKLFSCQDRAIRLELLTTMGDYIEYLDKKIVSEKIFPLLAGGFSDSEPLIRENSLKSVAHVISKLTERQINGELLRLLAKTQNDAVQEIRANTTILLGRIADQFAKSSRANVLTAAFSRALRDPFVQSRIAALLALTATADYYTPMECCNKIIGPLAPLLIDSDSNVRQQAIVTMDLFLAKVRAHADSLDRKQNNPESVSDATPDSAATSSSHLAATAAGAVSSLSKWTWSNLASSSDRLMSAPLDKKPTTAYTPSPPPQLLRSQQQPQQPQKVTLPPAAPFGDADDDDDANDFTSWNDDFDDAEQVEDTTKKTKNLSLEPDDEDEDGWNW
ncbi:hypothetical protein TRVA0_021S00760 [Trichomonascus vanleenenianus]|uniref:COPI-interacting protein CEX1 n=1 Tax=Trichomonascus vanleenenianus TaxID=2268995 RepID=UPI003ECB5C97